MKLLFCQNCKDVISLNQQVKKCSCGKTEGRYIDQQQAEYSGDQAVPFAIDNYSFFARLRGAESKASNEIYDQWHGKSKIQCWLLTEGNLNAELIKKIDKPTPAPRPKRRLGICGVRPH